MNSKQIFEYIDREFQPSGLRIKQYSVHLGRNGGITKGFFTFNREPSFAEKTKLQSILTSLFGSPAPEFTGRGTVLAFWDPSIYMYGSFYPRAALRSTDECHVQSVTNVTFYPMCARQLPQPVRARGWLAPSLSRR